MKANKFIDEFVLCPNTKPRKIYQLTSESNCCPACGEFHKMLTRFNMRYSDEGKAERKRALNQALERIGHKREKAIASRG